MRESKVERDCVGIAMQHGCMLEKWKGRDGNPDRILIPKNRPIVLVEFKSPRGALSVKQETKIEEIAERNHRVWIIDNIKSFHIALERHLR